MGQQTSHPVKMLPWSTSAVVITVAGIWLHVCRMLVLPGQAEAFTVFVHRAHTVRGSTSTAALSASSRGMGMGSSIKSKSTKKKKNGRNKYPKSSKNGNGSRTPFDVSASLLRLEKRYDRLLLAAAKRLQEEEEEDDYDDDIVTTEYVIAARDKTFKIVSDWVPVAQLCLARTARDAHGSEGSCSHQVRAALSLYCREISHVAGLGSRIFPSIPRSDLEYSVETVDSFYKYVYDVVVEPERSSSSGANQQAGGGQHGPTKMSKREARAVLQISEEEDCSLQDIKTRYRRLSFDCHPDRVAQLTEAERQAAAEEFGIVKLAYETLTESGWVRKDGASWYESIGGRARTDFVGPIELLPLAKAEIELASCQSAVIGLDPDLVQAFVTRSRTGGSQ